MELDKKEIWKKLGFILASNYRVKIFSALSQSEMTPKMLAKNIDVSINHVSNVLKNLSKEGLIECLNPDSKKGRIYSFTKEGKDLFKFMEKVNKNLK